MEFFNNKIEKIFEEGIKENYSLNVQESFENNLFNKINLLEKFVQEDIKSFRLAKVVTGVFVSIIVLSIIILFNFAISGKVYDSSIINIFYFISDLIQYVFTIFGIKGNLNLLLILIFSFILLVGIFYLDKYIFKRQTYRSKNL